MEECVFLGSQSGWCVTHHMHDAHDAHVAGRLFSSRPTELHLPRPTYHGPFRTEHMSYTSVYPGIMFLIEGKGGKGTIKFEMICMHG